ncbi:type II toxin-antitoxin system antitoxin VapB [Oribacterium parvum]|jgi:virulence-associated protein|uniref:type II toxin-antitoxin system antitoxin VapB n=1 Tax=Oribacterium parvum TaxID=1501329 RepID=UPI0028DB8B0E|nr:type II toxin-antitoxin system VapB family antitoxin [Oribacterium parvum]
MLTAKVFKNGGSQVIRLPKECRISSDEVMVNKIGDIDILLPKQNKWDSFMKAIEMFSDDFMADGRARDKVQENELI